jgi:hypothetical protein
LLNYYSENKENEEIDFKDSLKEISSNNENLNESSVEEGNEDLKSKVS